MPVTNYYSVNGRIIGEKTAGGSRIDYLTDALGSVTATVNQSAQVVNTYRYKPYGALLAKTGTGADPAFRWAGAWGYRDTGRRFSEAYVRARHLSPRIGGFTTADTVRHGLRRTEYAYADGSPVTKVDPSGRVAITVDLEHFIPKTPFGDWIELLPDWLKLILVPLPGALVDPVTATDRRDAFQHRLADGYRVRSRFSIDSTRIGIDDVTHRAFSGTTVLGNRTSFGVIILLHDPGRIAIDTGHSLAPTIRCESRRIQTIRACAAFLPSLDSTCIDYTVVVTFRVTAANQVTIYMRSVPDGIEQFPSIDAMVRVGNIMTGGWVPWFHIPYVPNSPHDAVGMALPRTMPLQIVRVSAPTMCDPALKKVDPPGVP